MFSLGEYLFLSISIRINVGCTTKVYYTILIQYHLKMKTIWSAIVCLALLLPLIGWGQAMPEQDQIAFYKNLGIQDAKQELAFVGVDQEDELDYWKDQKAFEQLLKKQNQQTYQAYIDGKYLVYAQHQLHCGGKCTHSRVLEAQKAFYVLNGTAGKDLETMVFGRGRKNEGIKQ